VLRDNAPHPGPHAEETSCLARCLGGSRSDDTLITAHQCVTRNHLEMRYAKPARMLSDKASHLDSDAEQQGSVTRTAALTLCNCPRGCLTAGSSLPWVFSLADELERHVALRHCPQSFVERVEHAPRHALCCVLSKDSLITEADSTVIGRE